MADYRKANHYRIFHFNSGPKEGLTDVIVTLDGGVFYRYERLSPVRAHHLIDMLRHENPIWIERTSGLFQVAMEPIGEAEPV